MADEIKTTTRANDQPRPLRVKRGPWTFALDIDTSRPVRFGPAPQVRLQREHPPLFTGSVIVTITGRAIALSMSPEEAEHVAAHLNRFAQHARELRGTPAPDTEPETIVEHP